MKTLLKWAAAIVIGVFIGINLRINTGQTGVVEAPVPIPAPYQAPAVAEYSPPTASEPVIPDITPTSIGAATAIIAVTPEPQASAALNSLEVPEIQLTQAQKDAITKPLVEQATAAAIQPTVATRSFVYGKDKDYWIETIGSGTAAFTRIFAINDKDGKIHYANNSGLMTAEAAAFIGGALKTGYIHGETQ